jgi:hypothetical protein
VILVGGTSTSLLESISRRVNFSVELPSPDYMTRKELWEMVSLLHYIIIRIAVAANESVLGL